MQDSAKYLIHADIRASGVVERSDVVGAIFGQTEGLLGDDLDLRDLQDASKVGRIDVQIESEAGRSYGTVTIASGLDKAETAVLAAALETIDRVGPCRAEFEVTDLEDARAAKRRAVVERATDLLAEFEETALSSRELVEEVRRKVRVEDITEYEGLPAGPRVTDSDAIIVVEGRADVLTLLRYGIKNAIAVEGTDVPDAVAELTRQRTVTTFLDGDRGGDLILKELAQIGAVDYVTFAPAGKSVEDLARDEVLSALRKKAPFDQLSDASSPRDAFTGKSTADPSAHADSDGETDSTGAPPPDDSRSDGTTDPADAETSDDRETAANAGVDAVETHTESSDTDDVPAATASVGPTSTDSETVSVDTNTAVDDTDDSAEPETESTTPETLAGHVEAVVGTDQVRLLDDQLAILTDAPATDAFDSIEAASETPSTVVLDGELSQRVLDIAAQRGVGQIVAASTGEFVKQPTSVRVRTASDI